MAFVRTLKCRAPDKWFSLLKYAHEDILKAAAGELHLGSARKLAEQRTKEWLGVQSSNKAGGGLGVFTNVDIPQVSRSNRQCLAGYLNSLHLLPLTLLMSKG